MWTVEIRPSIVAARDTGNRTSDECHTLPVWHVVREGGAGYSALAVASDGTILCAYETLDQVDSKLFRELAVGARSSRPRATFVLGCEYKLVMTSRMVNSTRHIRNLPKMWYNEGGRPIAPHYPIAPSPLSSDGQHVRLSASNSSQLSAIRIRKEIQG
jgi:hypothetical protein